MGLAANPNPNPNQHDVLGGPRDDRREEHLVRARGRVRVRDRVRVTLTLTTAVKSTSFLAERMARSVTAPG